MVHEIANNPSLVGQSGFERLQRRDVGLIDKDWQGGSLAQSSQLIGIRINAQCLQ